jgi:hypothetical protein
MAEYDSNRQSLFLAFRHDAREARERCKAYEDLHTQIMVDDERGIHAFFSKYIREKATLTTGLLLSGGIDSAIIASYLPEGTKTYTIRFLAEGFIDESSEAKKYAEFYGLKHETVDVSWDDYKRYSTILMRRKRAPLHAIEVALYKAASVAHSEGITGLFVGNGADSTFGGMDKLLSRDWSFDEFVERYTFIKPSDVLFSPIDVRKVYEPYKRGDGIDYISFLKEVHGIGIIEAFSNAINCAGCGIIDTYEYFKMNVPLDIPRIRAGESKYILQALFKERYPGFVVNKKIPFARPMNTWLGDWAGPLRPEFIAGCADSMSGDQRWLIYNLEEYLNMRAE